MGNLLNNELNIIWNCKDVYTNELCENFRQ